MKKSLSILGIFLVALYGCSSDDATTAPEEDAIEQPKDSIPNPNPDPQPDPDPDPDPNTEGWIIEAGFEDGTLGEKANGPDGFIEAYSQSNYSDEQAHTGTQSMKSTIFGGTDGFGDWGGLWPLPEHLEEGDEYWFRVYAYFPSGFDFSSQDASEGVKFMRSHTVSANDEHEGYQNFFLDTDGMVVATSVDTDTFYDNHPWPYEDIRGIGEVVSTDTWHAFEVYLKLHSEPGAAVFRCWQNGNLIFEDTQTPTLRLSTSKLDQASVWTYWNNTAPKTQSAFLDDIIITSATPKNMDAAGNAFIGLMETTNN